MNTYGYVGGNPLYWSDPYGLCPLAGAICGPAVAAGIALATGTSILGANTASNSISDAFSNSSSCNNPDNNDKCEELRNEIDKTVTELKVRYLQATVDKGDLYLNRRAGRKSWLGHKQQFEDKQTKLRNLIDEAVKNGCWYNAEASRMSSESFPTAPTRYKAGY